MHLSKRKERAKEANTGDRARGGRKPLVLTLGVTWACHAG